MKHQRSVDNIPPPWTRSQHLPPPGTRSQHFPPGTRSQHLPPPLGPGHNTSPPSGTRSQHLPPPPGHRSQHLPPPPPPWDQVTTLPPPSGHRSQHLTSPPPPGHRSQHLPPPRDYTQAGGTHPTGMHSCRPRFPITSPFWTNSLQNTNVFWTSLNSIYLIIRFLFWQK